VTGMLWVRVAQTSQAAALPLLLVGRYLEEWGMGQERCGQGR
jgi:hypothetical protein